MITRIAWIFLLPTILTLCAGAGLPASAAVFKPLSGGPTAPASEKAVIASALPDSPDFLLLANRGQWDATADLGKLHAVSTSHRGARLYFFDRGISIVHEGIAAAAAARLERGDVPTVAEASGLRRYRVDLHFVGASTPRVALEKPAGTSFNFYGPAFPGGIVGVEGYTRITYRGVYPGTDFVCELRGEGIKYEFRLQPGADPSRIRLRYDGAEHPALTADGSVHISHVAGELRDAAPVAWQNDGADVLPRDVRWSVENGEARFVLPWWDHDRLLVIDPFLQWSTFIGGKLSDYARDVAVDASGGMIVCGYSAGADFPVTPGAMQAASQGNFEVFITAFNRDRKQLWSTYYGGSGSEENPRIARAEDGLLYVTGSTSSTDLPVTPQAMQPRNGGRYDAFILALDAAGQRRWATYFGGSYSDECSDVAVAASGTVYVTGGTYSTNFPVTSDAVQTSNAGDYDMFVAQFSSKGTRQWASYVGGWSMDFATGIAVDDAGDIFLAGRTESTNFPAVAQGLQSSYGGGSFDAFVLKISGKSRKLLWSSYVGGEEEDNAECIALDEKGNILLAGYTASKSFPRAGNAQQKVQGGLIDAFIASMDGNGKLRWSTFLGGTEVDKATALTVDVFGNIMVSGFSGSKNFPVTGKGFQSGKGGGYDMFLAQFGPGGGYLWGTLYGGETHDIAYGLATDSKGNSIVVGGTESRGFRTAGNIFQGDLSGLTDAFVLRVIFNEPVASAGRDTTICLGGGALLGGEAAGGQPPYRYDWSPSASLSDARSARPVASPRSTSTYVLAITDAEGVVARDTVVVTVSNPPVVDAGDDVAICPGGSETLQVKARDGRGPYRFRWTPSEGLNNPEAANPVASPARTTRYVVTVTDALGCSARDSILIRVHPAIAVESGNAMTACADAPTRLQAAVTGGQAPFRFSWKPAVGLDNPTLQSPQLLPRSDAVYTVTVTDANGCVALDTLRINVHRPPVVDAGDNLSLCMGQDGRLAARVSGGRKPYLFRWSPSEGLSSAAELSPGIRPVRTALYVLTVTDANGCVVRDSALVAVHPQPTLQFAADVDACEGALVQIGAEAAGGTAPYRYRWTPATGLTDPNAPSPMASPKRNTTYTVSVTDANGCEVGASVRVNVRPRPAVRLRDRERICLGGSVQLAPSVRGGQPPYAYAWTPVAGLSAANIASPVASPTSPLTYTLRVTDAVGCVVEEKVDVEVLAPPVVNAGTDVTLCEGVPVTLDGRISGGRPPYSAVWSPSIGLSSVRALDPTVRTTVSRVYTLTVTDKNGCVATDEVAVTVAPSPRANAGADVRLCAGTPTPLDGSATGGSPPYRYSWTPVTGLSNPAAAQPTAQPSQTTTYTLTVTDARGCSSSDEVTVSVYPAPQITAAREISICRNQGRRLEVSAVGGRKPYRYEWTPMEGLSDGRSESPVANPIQTTTYTVSVIDQNGCRAFATITVTVLPCNKTDAGEDEVLCQGGELRLGPSSVDTLHGARYSWAPATGLSSSTVATPIARPSKTTRYILSKRNRFDCTSNDTVTVTVRPVPEVDAGKDLVLCPGAAGNLKGKAKGGTPPYSFRWQPADGLNRTDALATRAAPRQSTSYRLTVTDANGCIAEDSVDVTIPEPIVMKLQRQVQACEGTEVTLGGPITGGVSPYSVFWSPATALSDRKSRTPTLTVTTSTRYSVTITDANGCQSVDSVQLIMRPAPLAKVRIDGKPELCEGETLRLSAPPGYARYAWSTGSRDTEITVGNGGSYTVTVTDADGCSAVSEPVEVTQHALPKPSITARGPLSFCEGDSVVLDAGKGFTSYAWTTGATTRSIGVRSAGSYGVTVTGDGGCAAAAAQVNVFVRPAPVAAVLQRLDTLLAVPADQYQWLRDGKPLVGATERMLLADRSARYSVRTSNGEGCSAESRPLALTFATASVRFPQLRARRGDTIDIPVQLASSRGLDKAGADTLIVTLRSKKKRMRVISGGVEQSEPGGEDFILIPGRYERGSKTLAVLRVVILEGDGVIPLEPLTARWLNGLVRTDMREGKIRLRK
jgi:hypothetical protein